MSGYSFFRGLELPLCLFAALLAAVSAHAQQDRAGFCYERTIIPGGAGPNRLDIDVPLLAAGNPFRELSRSGSGTGTSITLARNGLSDLRIYDKGGREVPYLMIEPPAVAPRWVAARPVAAAADPITVAKTSKFEIDYGRLLSMDCLRMEGIPAPFMKLVRLEGSADRDHWIILTDKETLFDLPTDGHSRLELNFEPGSYRYLRVTSDDSASARLPLPKSCFVRLVAAGALPSPLRVPLQFEGRGGEPGISRYRLRMPGAHLPVTAVEITCKGGSAMRQTRVSEGRLGNGEIAPYMLGLATLWHSAKAGSTDAVLHIPITPPRESVFDLTIHDGNYPPLDLTDVTAVLAYLPWIYFESSNMESLTAVFGNPGVAAPRYDLERARDSVVKQRAAQARWGKLKARSTHGERSLRQAILFWCVLGAAVIFLLVLIARLLNSR